MAILESIISLRDNITSVLTGVNSAVLQTAENMGVLESRTIGELVTASGIDSLVNTGNAALDAAEGVTKLGAVTVDEIVGTQEIDKLNSVSDSAAAAAGSMTVLENSAVKDLVDADDVNTFERIALQASVTSGELSRIREVTAGGLIGIEDADKLSLMHEKLLLLEGKWIDQQAQVAKLNAEFDEAVRMFGHGSAEVDKLDAALLRARIRENELGLSALRVADNIGKQERKAADVRAKVEQTNAQENKLDIAAIKVASELSKQEQKAAAIKNEIEEQVTAMGKASDHAKKISQRENDIKNETRAAADHQDRFARAASLSHLNLINVYAAVQLIKTGAQLISKALTAADEYSDINARLSMINDGIMTQEQLQNSVYQAARNTKSAYSEIADTVTRIGWNAEGLFLNNKSIVNFAEIATKAMKMGSRSASINGQALTYVLQGFEAGGLTGYNYTSLARNASGQAFLRYVAEGLDVSMGKLQQMAKDGELTAVVVAESLSRAADTINQDFSKLPTTFGENMTKLKDIATSWLHNMNQEGGFLYEVNQKIADFSSWLEGVGGQQMFQHITKAISFAGSVISPIIDTIAEQIQRLINLVNNPGNQEFFKSLRLHAQRAGEIIRWVITTSVDLASKIVENWTKIEPIVWAVVAGIAAFKAVMLAATAAQWALNAASIAFPSSWLIAAIGGVVAAFSILLMRILGTKNAISDTLDKLNNMSRSIKDTYDITTDDGQVVTAPIDRDTWVIETDIVPESPASIAENNSNIMPEGLRGTNLGNILSADMEKRENENKNINNDRSYWGDLNMDQTADKITKIQSDIENTYQTALDSFANTFSPDDDKYQYDWENDRERYGLDDKSIEINPYYGKDFNLGNIDSVGSIRDTVDISSQDLKYLRDIAEREAINEFTTNVVVPQTQVSFGDIRETADVEKIYGRITEIVEEELLALAEGVH